MALGATLKITSPFILLRLHQIFIHMKNKIKKLCIVGRHLRDFLLKIRKFSYLRERYKYQRKNVGGHFHNHAENKYICNSIGKNIELILSNRWAPLCDNLFLSKVSIYSQKILLNLTYRVR